MAIQYNITPLINDRLNLLLTDAGNAAIMRIWSGSMPAHCATADSGTKLTDDSLPSTWMGSASAGVVSKSGTWTLNGVAGAGSGTAAGYFRIYDSGLVKCYMQGTITATGGGGDMTLDNVSIANAQVITVNTFSITGGNA
jgi:hypothetical protein